MDFINSWKSKVKQKDKFQVCLRVSIVTVFELDIDVSSKKYEVTLLNFGIKF